MRNEIRSRLLARNLELPDIARMLGRSVGYISRALNGKTKFKVDEAFNIGDKLGLTLEQVKEWLS